jgi:iron uptake system component EfeO
MSSPSRSPLLLLAATALPLFAITSPVHADPAQVVVTDKGCKPDTLTVEEGRSAFKIKNESQRALEWEILNGVMVVAERENIIPGFTQSLTATLEPGEYAMTCGLLINPRGRLIVTAAANTAAAKPIDPRELVAPLAEYKVYVTR